jgi:outer membrane lipoprotein LolB
VSLKSCLLLVITLSVSCTNPIIKPVNDQYHLTDRTPFYTLNKWSFKGRLALSNTQKSLTINIEWRHTEDKEILKLSGPLGQNAMLITLTEQLVILNQGNGKIQQSTKINTFIKQQLGIAIPVQSLRYWVLGLTHPNKKFTALADGFKQQHWIVQYTDMQSIDQQWMPRKLTALKDKIRLKLIIDHWLL